MQPQQRLFWFRRLALGGTLLAGTVTVLGAWVRLTDAGLGCPDWPGCYGHLVPHAHHVQAHAGFEFGKALHEMIHRYFAGALVLIIASLLGWAALFRKDRGQPLMPVALLFLVVCFQAALGAFTVTKLLTPLIVTAHLLGGLSTLGILCWLAQTPPMRPLSMRETALRKYALTGFAVLTMQIALGGWTSTNYAAVACPDFPTCQHSWWPRMDFQDAFVLWRGLGIDYAGGVLSNPARIAIHFAHRLGALTAGCVLTGLGLLTVLTARSRRLRAAGSAVLAAVLLQILIGVAMVRWGVPLGPATAHNAGAALLVVSMVTLLRALWPSPAIGMVPLPRVDHPR